MAAREFFCFQKMEVAQEAAPFFFSPCLGWGLRACARLNISKPLRVLSQTLESAFKQKRVRSLKGYLAGKGPRQMLELS